MEKKQHHRIEQGETPLSRHKALHQFETERARHEQLRQAGSLLPYSEALEHCRDWILVKGATTSSADTLQLLLSSLADNEPISLSAIRGLDLVRLSWITTIMINIHHISNRGLLYAAGQALDDNVQQ